MSKVQIGNDFKSVYGNVLMIYGEIIVKLKFYTDNYNSLEERVELRTENIEDV